MIKSNFKIINMLFAATISYAAENHQQYPSPAAARDVDSDDEYPRSVAESSMAPDAYEELSEYGDAENNSSIMISPWKSIIANRGGFQEEAAQIDERYVLEKLVPTFSAMFDIFRDIQSNTKKYGSGATFRSNRGLSVQTDVHTLSDLFLKMDVDKPIYLLSELQEGMRIINSIKGNLMQQYRNESPEVLKNVEDEIDEAIGLFVSHLPSFLVDCENGQWVVMTPEQLNIKVVKEINDAVGVLTSILPMNAPTAQETYKGIVNYYFSYRNYIVKELGNLLKNNKTLADRFKSALVRIEQKEDGIIEVPEDFNLMQIARIFVECINSVSSGIFELSVSDNGITVDVDPSTFLPEYTEMLEVLSALDPSTATKIKTTFEAKKKELFYILDILTQKKKSSVGAKEIDVLCKSPLYFRTAQSVLKMQLEKEQATQEAKELALKNAKADAERERQLALKELGLSQSTAAPAGGKPGKKKKDHKTDEVTDAAMDAFVAKQATQPQTRGANERKNAGTQMLVDTFGKKLTAEALPAQPLSAKAVARRVASTMRNMEQPTQKMALPAGVKPAKPQQKIDNLHVNYRAMALRKMETSRNDNRFISSQDFNELRDYNRTKRFLRDLGIGIFKHPRENKELFCWYNQGNFYSYWIDVVHGSQSEKGIAAGWHKRLTEKLSESGKMR